MLFLALLAMALFSLQPGDGAADAGGSLVVAELNFSVDVPGEDWEWRELPGEEASRRQFICENRETGGRILMMVFDGRWEAFDEEGEKQFLAGLTKSWTDQGWRVEERFMEAAALDLPHARRLGFRLDRDSGNSIYSTGYTVTSGRLYAFQAFSESNQEPMELTGVAESFRLIGPSPAEPSVWFGQILMFGYFLFLGGCGFVAWMLNWIGARRRFNGWLVGTLAILVMSSVFFVYFVVRLPAETTPFRRGELFGSMIFGPTLFPVLLGWFLSRRFSRSAMD